MFSVSITVLLMDFAVIVAFLRLTRQIDVSWWWVIGALVLHMIFAVVSDRIKKKSVKHQEKFIAGIVDKALRESLDEFLGKK